MCHLPELVLRNLIITRSGAPQLLADQLYFVILLGRFPLVRKIKKNFGHFFHFIAVQKVISRHIFRRRGAEGPETSKNVSRNHFLNQDKMWKWSNFSKFLLNKCMKTIQVMQQTIFFYFGIDLRTTFQSPTDGRACQGPGMPRTGHAKDVKFFSKFFQNGGRRPPFWKNFEKNLTSSP